MQNDPYMTKTERESKLFNEALGSYHNESLSTLNSLDIRRNEKINRLSQKNKVGTLDRDSILLTPDMPHQEKDTRIDLGGFEESAGNKLFNDLTDNDIQTAVGTLVKNFQLAREEDTGRLYFNRVGEDNEERQYYDGPASFLYGYGAEDDQFKLGMSRGDLPSSDYRYQPGRAEAEGYRVGANGYGWEAGPKGVNLNDRKMELLLPSNITETLENLIHGRKKALENRSLLSNDPNFAERRKELGGGWTEYYKNGAKGAFGDLGDAKNPKLSANQWEHYQNKANMNVHTLMQDLGLVPTDDKYYEDRQLQRRLNEINRMGAAERAAYETGQTISGALSAIPKGAIDLVDALGEFVTWGPQTLVRAITGNKNFDIDIIPDEFKERVIAGIDKITGYERNIDDASISKIMEKFVDTDIDITSITSFEKAFKDPEKRKAILGIVKEVGVNPSVGIAALFEIIGSGGALGFITKGAAKASAAVAPALTDKIGKALETNSSKLRESVKAANGLPPAERAAKLKELEKSYTIAKKLPDLLKGTVFTNADMMVRFNNDIDEFKANNNEEDPGAMKLLQMAVVNRITSSMEVASAKYMTKVGSISVGEAKESVMSAFKDAALHIFKAGMIEGVQETFDGIGEQINQKLGSADYKDKTLKDILKETSAEILTGTAIGAGTGVYVGGVSALGEPLGKGVVKGYGYLEDKALEYADKTSQVYSNIKNDAIEAFGGEKEVENNLKTLGKTPEEREAKLEASLIERGRVYAADAERLNAEWKSALEVSPDTKIDKVLGDTFAKVIISDLIEFQEETVKELALDKTLSDAEKSKKLEAVEKDYINNLAVNLNVFRAGGRGDEADNISKALISYLPSLAKQLGSKPEMLTAVSSILPVLLQDAVNLSDTDYTEVITAVNNFVKGLKSTVTPEDVNRINLLVKEEITSTDAYRQLKKENKTTEVVGVDAAVGKRGFLSYYDGFTHSIATGNKTEATAFFDAMSRFKALQEKKKETLESEVGKMQEAIETTIINYKTEHSKASSSDVRSHLFKQFGGSDSQNAVAIHYGTGSSDTFNIAYSHVIDYVLSKGQERKGVFKVIDNVTSEISAMDTLVASALMKQEGNTTKQPIASSTEAKVTSPIETIPNETPLTATPTESQIAGKYKTDKGKIVTVSPAGDNKFTIQGEGVNVTTSEKGVTNQINKKTLVPVTTTKVEGPEYAIPESLGVIEDSKASYEGVYTAGNNSYVVKPSVDMYGNNIEGSWKISHLDKKGTQLSVKNVTEEDMKAFFKDNNITPPDNKVESLSTPKYKSKVQEELVDAGGLAAMLGVVNKNTTPIEQVPNKEITSSIQKLTESILSGTVSPENLLEAVSWLNTSNVELTEDRKERATFKTKDKQGNPLSAEEINKNKQKFEARSKGNVNSYLATQLLEEVAEVFEEKLIEDGLLTPDISSLLELQKRALKTVRFGTDTIIKDPNSKYNGQTNQQVFEQLAKEQGVTTESPMSAVLEVAKKLNELMAEDPIVAGTPLPINDTLGEPIGAPDSLLGIPQNRGEDSVDSVLKGIKAKKETPQTNKSKVETVERYSKQDIQANAGNKVYVFGDNVERTGNKGQAAAARGEPNTIGIATKKKPSMDESAFFTDTEFDSNRQIIDKDIKKLEEAISEGKTVVLPKDGIGTGLAKLSEKAPKTWNYLASKLNNALGFTYLPTVDVKDTTKESMDNFLINNEGAPLDTFIDNPNEIPENALIADPLDVNIPSDIGIPIDELNSIINNTDSFNSFIDTSDKIDNTTPTTTKKDKVEPKTNEKAKLQDILKQHNEKRKAEVKKAKEQLKEEQKKHWDSLSDAGKKALNALLFHEEKDVNSLLDVIAADIKMYKNIVESSDKAEGKFLSGDGVKSKTFVKKDKAKTVLEQTETLVNTLKEKLKDC